MADDAFPALNFPIHEGIRIDHYQIAEKLGAGGMGVVYKAHDLQLRRMVAVKFMHNQGDDAQRYSRFAREREITARLLHPHIVKVFHIGLYHEHPYFVMEYIDGKPIHKYVTERRLPVEKIAELVEKIALALDYAHGCGVIHRDVKPSNIMVRDDGEPVLMDFGLARVSKVDDRALTRSGEVIGTPEYMSPEQARGLRREIDGKSDLYGLGATFYHLLAGVPPVQGENVLEKICQVIEKPPVPPSQLRPEMPADIEKICIKALEKAKKNRYASCRQLALDLHRYREGKNTFAGEFYLRRKRGLWLRAACVFALLVTLVTGMWLWSPSVDSKNLHGKADPIDYSKQVQIHYQVAKEKLQQRAHEAYLYLQKVAQMAEQLGTQQDNQAMQEIRRRLPYDLLQAAYACGDYEQACKHGQHLLAQYGENTEPSALWQLVQAAYHCSRLEEMQQYLQTMERRLATEPAGQSKDRAYAGGVDYCHGLLCFANSQFAQARERFSAARRQWHNGVAEFADSLCLHYSASMLVDLDASLSAADWETLVQCWESLDKSTQIDRLPRLLFLETRARYLLRLAARERGEIRQLRLQEVFRLLAACWAESHPLGVWYYIRGKAYLLGEKYIEAEQDFQMAYELDHKQLSALIAKLDLIWRIGDLPSLRRYAIEESIYTHSNRVSVLTMFADEMDVARKRRVSSRTGIPFAGVTFAEYYKKLRDPSPEVRQIAETAICSMLPPQDAVAALRQATAGENSPDTERQNARLITAIEDKERARRHDEFLLALSCVSPLGTILNLEKFQRDYFDLLQQTLAEAGDLCQRFLAARVLAHIPSRQSRNYLWQTWLQADKNEQGDVNKVLVARALQEVGYEYCLVDAHWVERLAQRLPAQGGFIFSHNQAQEEFLQALLAELLLPHQAAAWPILTWQLASASMRVRLAAASRFYWPLEMTQQSGQTLDNLLRQLQAAIDGKDAEMRCFALRSLSRYLQSPDIECQLQWQQLVQQHFLTRQSVDSLCRHFTIGSLNEQNALLHFWHEAALLPALREHKDKVNQICALVRPCWDNIDPVARCQAISTSTILGDKEVYERILFSPQQGVGEKLGVVLSFLKTNAFIPQTRQQIPFVLSKVLARDNTNETGLRIRALLIYLFGMFEDGSNPWLVPKILQALDDSSHLVRCAALSALGGWPNISAKTWDKVQNMCKNDSDEFVRYAASGLMLHHSLRHNLGLHEALHREIKNNAATLPGSPHLVAVWGYSLGWEKVTAPRALILRRVEWNAEQLLEHRRLAFLVYAADPTNRRQAQLCERLERITDLLGEQVLDPAYQDSAYLLAAVYAMEGRRPQAIELLRSVIERLAAQDRHFTLFWTQMMWQAGREDEARLYLQRKQSEQLQWTPGDLSQSRQQSCYYAALLRSQAFLEMQGKTMSPQLTSIAHEQYLLYPELPSSLALWGEYCYRQQRYDLAIQIFRELQMRLPQSCEFSVWLARIHVQRRNFEEAVACLRLAFCQDRYLRCEDLQQYPELQPFLARPEVQAIWQERR